MTINELKAKIMRELKDYQLRRVPAVYGGVEKSQSLRLGELSGKSLSEIGSQMLYKTESVQNKLLSNLSIIEEGLAKYAETVRGMRSDLTTLGESAKIKEVSLMNELDLMRKQLAKVEGNMRDEDIRANKRYDEAIIRVKEEHMQEINRLRESHQKAIKELNELHYAEQKEVESKLVHVSADSKKMEELNEYTARLENVMRSLREKLKEYYDKQRPLQTSWKDEDAHTDVEEVLYMEFALYSANKFGTDNKWLVERLAEFGKDNEKLKESLSKAMTVPNPQFLKDVSGCIIFWFS